MLFGCGIMEEIEIKYSLLKEIISVTKGLYMLKNQLLELKEKNNIYDDIYYQYQQLLKIEEKLYNKINNNSNIMLDFLNYLYQRYDLEEYDINIYYISNIEKNTVYKRIVNKLNNYIFKLPLEKIEELGEFDERQVARINKERMIVRKKIIVNKALENDYLQLFINDLNAFINNEMYRQYIGKIESIKNDLLFSFCDLEENDTMDIEKPVFIKSKMVSDVLGLSEEEYDEIKDEFMDMVINENLSDSMWNELNNDVNINKIILYDLLLTAFSLLDNSSYDNYLRQVKEYIEEYSDGRDYCIKFVNDMEENIDKFRGKHRVISLRKPKSL